MLFSSPFLLLISLLFTPTPKNHKAALTALLEFVQLVGGKPELTGGLADRVSESFPKHPVNRPTRTQEEEEVYSQSVGLLPWRTVLVLAVGAALSVCLLLV